MELKPFELENFLAKHEFVTKYTLSSSDCEPLELSALIRGAKKEHSELWDNLKLGYTQPEGQPLLRGEIAKLYQGISSEQVIVTSSTQEAIYLLLQSLLQKGDHVVMMPGYQGQYAVAEGMGCKISFWKPDSSQCSFNVSDLLALVTPETKLIFLTFPHNPTSYVPTKEEFQELMQFAYKRGIRVVCDEIYRFLESVPADRLESAAEVDSRNVTLSGVSKAFGLAGLRIGWIVTKDSALLQKIQNYKSYTTICCSAPSEILAIIGLHAREEILRQNLTLISQNRKLFEEFLQRHPDKMSCKLPGAGSVCLARVHGDASCEAFCTKVIEKANVMLIPSNFFGLGNQHVRIGLGRKSFEKALGVLEDYLAHN